MPSAVAMALASMPCEAEIREPTKARHFWGVQHVRHWAGTDTVHVLKNSKPIPCPGTTYLIPGAASQLRSMHGALAKWNT